MVLVSKVCPSRRKRFSFYKWARDQTEFFRVKIIETIRAFGTNSDRFPLCADGENLSTFAASSFASSFHDDFRVTRGAFNKHLVMGLGDMLRKTVILGGADGAATFFTSGFGARRVMAGDDVCRCTSRTGFCVSPAFAG